MKNDLCDLRWRAKRNVKKCIYERVFRQRIKYFCKKTKFNIMQCTANNIASTENILLNNCSQQNKRSAEEKRNTHTSAECPPSPPLPFTRVYHRGFTCTHVYTCK